VSLRHTGDLAGAKECWEQVLASPPARYFASVNTGIRGYLTRQNLTALYYDLGDFEAAEAQWRAFLEERPDY
jgi:hypothetical protein